MQRTKDRTANLRLMMYQRSYSCYQVIRWTGLLKQRKRMIFCLRLPSSSALKSKSLTISIIYTFMSHALYINQGSLSSSRLELHYSHRLHSLLLLKKILLLWWLLCNLHTKQHIHLQIMADRHAKLKYCSLERGGSCTTYTRI